MSGLWNLARSHLFQNSSQFSDLAVSLTTDFNIWVFSSLYRDRALILSRFTARPVLAGCILLRLCPWFFTQIFFSPLSLCYPVNPLPTIRLWGLEYLLLKTKWFSTQVGWFTLEWHWVSIWPLKHTIYNILFYVFHLKNEFGFMVYGPHCCHNKHVETCNNSRYFLNGSGKKKRVSYSEIKCVFF